MQRKSHCATLSLHATFWPKIPQGRGKSRNLRLTVAICDNYRNFRQFVEFYDIYRNLWHFVDTLSTNLSQNFATFLGFPWGNFLARNDIKNYHVIFMSFWPKNPLKESLKFASQPPLYLSENFHKKWNFT